MEFKIFINCLFLLLLGQISYAYWSHDRCVGEWNNRLEYGPRNRLGWTPIADHSTYFICKDVSSGCRTGTSNWTACCDSLCKKIYKNVTWRDKKTGCKCYCGETYYGMDDWKC